MSEMLANNPLYDILEQKNWNWIQFVLSIPVVFYATWMFFERAYKSIKTWNLNMFTLIGIGAGVAWLFSVFGMLFYCVFSAIYCFLVFLFWRKKKGSMILRVRSASCLCPKMWRRTRSSCSACCTRAPETGGGKKDGLLFLMSICCYFPYCLCFFPFFR